MCCSSEVAQEAEKVLLKYKTILSLHHIFCKTLDILRADLILKIILALLKIKVAYVYKPLFKGRRLPGYFAIIA